MSKRNHNTYATLRRFALTFPGAHEDFPWGEAVIKVKAKVFVFLGHRDRLDDEVSMSMKLPESGPFVLDRGWGKPTGYGLGKSGWVTITLAGGDRPPLAALRDWIEESYRAVAPKKLIKELDSTT